MVLINSTADANHSRVVGLVNEASSLLTRSCGVKAPVTDAQKAIVLALEECLVRVKNWLMLHRKLHFAG